MASLEELTKKLEEWKRKQLTEQDGDCPELIYSFYGVDDKDCAKVFRCRLQEVSCGDAFFAAESKGKGYIQCACKDHTACEVYANSRRH